MKVSIFLRKDRYKLKAPDEIDLTQKQIDNGFEDERAKNGEKVK